MGPVEVEVYCEFCPESINISSVANQCFPTLRGPHPPNPTSGPSPSPRQSPSLTAQWDKKAGECAVIWGGEGGEGWSSAPILIRAGRFEKVFPSCCSSKFSPLFVARFLLSSSHPPSVSCPSFSTSQCFFYLLEWRRTSDLQTEGSEVRGQ